MVIFSIFRHYRLRLMRPRLSLCRQRARAPSTVATAMLLTICPSYRSTAMLSARRRPLAAQILRDHRITW